MHCGVCCVHCVMCVVWCAVCMVRCAVCIVWCAVCIVRCAVSVRCVVCCVHCVVCCVHCAVCCVGFACTSSCRHSAAADEPGTRHISSPPFEITAAAYVVLVSVPTRGSSVGVVYSYKLGDRE